MRDHATQPLPQIIPPAAQQQAGVSPTGAEYAALVEAVKFALPTMLPEAAIPSRKRESRRTDSTP